MQILFGTRLLFYRLLELVCVLLFRMLAFLNQSERASEPKEMW